MIIFLLKEMKFSPFNAEIIEAFKESLLDIFDDEEDVKLHE